MRYHTMKRIMISLLALSFPAKALAQTYEYGAPYGSYAARQNEMIDQQQRIIKQQEEMQRQMRSQQDMEQGYRDGSSGSCGPAGSFDYQEACNRARTNAYLNRSSNAPDGPINDPLSGR